MIIKHTKSFDRTFKKLKKHNNEYNNCCKIIEIIENTRTFDDLCNLPQVKMYGFERLKHNLNDYYSFNLCKRGGVIRLIVKPVDNCSIELFLITISYNHYEDFDPEGVNYYE